MSPTAYSTLSLMQPTSKPPVMTPCIIHRYRVENRLVDIIVISVLKELEYS